LAALQMRCLLSESEGEWTQLRQGQRGFEELTSGASLML
jgi:hypothetical protein